MLKVHGRGGGGYNMFAVQQTSNLMESIPGYNYRVGVAQFSSVVTVIQYMAKKLMIAFYDGNVLKVHGTGGGGNNMFAITETSTTFNSVSGYNYFAGAAKFSSFVTAMQFNTVNTLIGFYNGKMLKVKGIGGEGQNMFAVTETNGCFYSVSGYNYFIGCAKFYSGVSLIRQVSDNGEKTLIALRSGEVLKVSGTGGGGQNMFAVTELPVGFSSIPNYNYYVGDAMFKSAVTHVIYVNNEMMMAFSNGKILKVKGSGGSSSNMFRVFEGYKSFSNFGC